MSKRISPRYYRLKDYCERCKSPVFFERRENGEVVASCQCDTDPPIPYPKEYITWVEENATEIKECEVYPVVLARMYAVGS